MKKSILILALTITTLFVGCGCSSNRSDASNQVANTESIPSMTNTDRGSSAGEDLGTTTAADRGASAGEILDNTTEVSSSNSQSQNTSDAIIHIYRENGKTVYSEELETAVRSIEGVSKFSEEDFEETMFAYYAFVRKLDNTILYPEYIHKAVAAIGTLKGYKVGAITYLEGYDEVVHIDTGSSSSSNSGNTGGGNGGSQSDNNSQTSEEDFTTPENNNPSTGSGSDSSGSDARPGETTVDLDANDAEAGDGGELITDITLNP